MPSYIYNPTAMVPAQSVDHLTDRSLQRYWPLRSLPETPWDLGFVRQETPIRLHLYNGESSSMQFTGVSYSGADGISVVSPAAYEFPLTIGPRSGEWVDIVVSLNGPTQVDAYITLATDKGDLVIHIYGIRAPFLEGSIATLTWPHNWKEGYTQTISWKTDVLTSYDGSEQRIGLIPLPRKSYSLSYLEEGKAASLLGTYLAARRTDYFLIPTWHDVGVLTEGISEGDITIPVDTLGKDYTPDQKAFIWIDEDTYDEVSILTVNPLEIVLLDGVSRDYPANTRIAPMRPYYLSSNVTVKKHTNLAIEFSCDMSSVYDTELEITYVKEVYNGYEVLPSDVNYVVSDDPISHKWQVLDSGFGLPAIVKESIDPIYTYKLEILTLNREESHLFYQFLHVIRGQVTPFWLLNKSDDLFPVADLVQDDNKLLVSYCKYTDDSENERGKKYIQIQFTDGSTERYSIVGSSFNPIFPTQEELQVSPVFPANRQLSEIVSIKYLQLVRFASDSFSLKWETEGKFRCSTQVKVLV